MSTGDGRRASPRGTSGRGGLRRPLLPGSGPLAGVSPLVGFLAVAGVFLVGVVLGGPIGTTLLALLAVGVLVLLAASWPRLTPPERLARVAALAVLVAVAVAVGLR